MGTQVLVSVTKQDIQQGIRNSAESCPIAHAVKRATGLQASVNGTRVKTMKNGATVKRVPSSTQIATFVRRFDRDGAANVAPFEFWLDE